MTFLLLFVVIIIIIRYNYYYFNIVNITYFNIIILILFKLLLLIEHSKYFIKTILKTINIIIIEIKIKNLNKYNY